jgi:diacylglycerol O-acyltransferase / wax synthase
MTSSQQSDEQRTMAIHPMDPADAAWYHMDGPANPAMTTGLLLTKTPLRFDKVRALYAQRIVRFDRFTQRVVERGFPVATPHWEDMPRFDIDQHLHHIALPAPGGRAAFQALIADLASTPLDHQQPLWQVHVVDGVDGGSALVWRCHHCIADGTAMMTVVQGLFDTTARGSARLAAPPRLARRRAALSRSLLETGWAAAGAALDLATHPRQAIDKLALVAGGAAVLLGELLKRNDPRGPLKGEFGLRQQVAWSERVAIADVKAIGARHGAKVNDVLVAAMSGALRAYLKQRGVDLRRATVRAMVPVDLRPPERMGQLGNEFGLVVLELALTAARAQQRLALTKARMDTLKRSPEPIAMRALFDIFGRGPKMLEDIANDWFGSKASIVMTNVAGPRETLYLAGAEIERVMFWVAHPGRQLGMGISIMSYRGYATLGIIADARLVPDPQTIAALFDREFGTLRRAAVTPAAAPRARTVSRAERRAA